MPPAGVANSQALSTQHVYQATQQACKEPEFFTSMQQADVACSRPSSRIVRLASTGQAAIMDCSQLHGMELAKLVPPLPPVFSLSYLTSVLIAVCCEIA